MAENNINDNNNQNNDVLMDGLHQPQNQPDDTGLPQQHQQQQDTDSSFSGAEAATTATNPSKQQISASLLEVSSLLEGRLKSRSGSTNNEGEEEDAGLVVAPGTSSQVNKNDTYEIGRRRRRRKRRKRMKTRRTTTMTTKRRMKTRT